jgi:hypothetical protein
MGWSIGEHNGRDIGYGVPALCDHPECGTEIDRGLSYVCGGSAYGGDHGCGLFFCGHHLTIAGPRRNYAPLCQRCYRGRAPFDPKPDVAEWARHKLTDESWAKWRVENADWVARHA